MSIEKSSGERGFWGNLGRLTRHRLIVPLQRGQMPPEFVARGVAVGLAVAFTPTVGIQLILVLAIWGLAKWLGPRFHFHMVAAMAWVWVTNLFTIGPIYYVFLLTGQLMLGRFDELGSVGLDSFTERLTAVVSADVGFLEGLWVGTLALFDIWGLPLFLGSLPWAIGTAWIGYVWSARFITRFREARRKRWENRAARRAVKQQKKKQSEVAGNRVSPPQT
ncbi:DUF2062 domain-containing protein [Minwuia sp.]|uniref:DUF2062 domain-containing protein n=1 Tax=Minwuia sp. TaxID=2493630 RepID=UPI003A8FCB13